MVRFVCCFFLFGMLLLAGVAPGCTREYSFEGRDTANTPAPTPLPIDTSVIADTMPPPQTDSCAGCNNAFIAGQWSVQLNGAILCGEIDTAILNLERNAFTFFGPLSCAPDFGLIITVSLEPEKLDQNRQSVLLPRSSFHYYDNRSGLKAVQSVQGKPFAVYIQHYDHATKEAQGTFSGTGYTKDGKAIAITDGKWKTHLK